MHPIPAQPYPSHIQPAIHPSRSYSFPCKISYENLVLDQDTGSLYLMILSILIICLLYNVQILMGEVTCWSPLRIQGLKLLDS